MAVPYKSGDWKESLIILGALVAGLAAAGGVLAILIPREKQLHVWVFVTPVVMAGLALTRLRRHAELRRLATELEGMGVKMLDQLTPADKQQIAPYLGGLAQTFELKNGVDGIQWFASNREIVFFEHMYTVGSGKHAQVFTHVIVAFPVSVGHLADAPLLTATCVRRGRLGARKRAREDLKTADEDFDQRWEIWGDDGTRAKFLTDATRSALADSPRGEKWHVGDGWMACGYDLALDPENSLKFLHRTRQIVS